MPDGTPTWVAFSSNNVIPAGSSSYSSTPTMAEINLGSGVNQIVAFARRKQIQIQGTSSLGYCTHDNVLGASYLSNIATQIDSVRSSVGLSTGFTNSITSDLPMKAAWFTECQTRLALTHAISLSSNKTAKNTGGVYPLFGATNTYSTLPGGFGTFTIGKLSATPNTERRRLGMFLALNSIGTDANATFSVGPENYQNGETFTPRLYVSNTDDSAFTAGWETHLDNNCGDGTYGASPMTITISNAILSARANANMSMILGINTEMTSTGVGLVNASFDMTNFFDIAGSLTINF